MIEDVQFILIQLTAYTNFVTNLQWQYKNYNVSHIIIKIEATSKFRPELIMSVQRIIKVTK